MSAVLERPDVLHIDDCDLNDARALAQGFATQQYGYVVTANVDHVVRYYHNPDFRALYAAAIYVLLDSRFLVHVLSVPSTSDSSSTDCSIRVSRSPEDIRRMGDCGHHLVIARHSVEVEVAKLGALFWC